MTKFEDLLFLAISHKVKQYSCIKIFIIPLCLCKVNVLNILDIEVVTTGECDLESLLYYSLIKDNTFFFF